jgi:hypothetical protein
MKTKLFLFISALLCCLTLVAQPPQSIKYQGVVRDNSGNPLSNKHIALRINILQQTETGKSVYIEEHFTTTNPFGLFNINIGTGKKIQGRFDTISWNSYNYFQKIEIDTMIWDVTDPVANHYVWMGTSQILSVPYSLASNVSNSTLNNGYEKMWVFDTPGQYLFSITGGEGNYMIETWGAGGGAFFIIDSINISKSVVFAGGGGAFAKSYFHLKNGDGFVFQVGKGGILGYEPYSNIDEYGDGESSFIDNRKGIFVKAGGGKGGSRVGPGGYGTGQFCINGQAGQYGGDGGRGNNGGNSPNGGYGGYLGSDGTAPGGGGSAVLDYRVVNDTLTIITHLLLGNGGNGRVVIHGQGNATVQPWTGSSN